MPMAAVGLRVCGSGSCDDSVLHALGSCTCSTTKPSLDVCSSVLVVQPCCQSAPRNSGAQKDVLLYVMLLPMVAAESGWEPAPACSSQHCMFSFDIPICQKSYPCYNRYTLS
jgi:hypothetical protein